MQSTLLALVLLLISQVGDRYPSPSGVQEDEAAPAGETEIQPPAASESQAQESPSAGDGAVDQIDATAEPLTDSSHASPPTTELETGQGTSPPQSSASPPATTPSSTTSAHGVSDPAEVLASILEPPLGSELTGTTLTLIRAVDNSLSRNEQTQRVIAYWELSQAVANYYLAYKERTELAALRQGVALPGVDWDTARQNVEDRLQLATDRVRAAQEYLTQLMGASAPGLVPLPSDMPFCGRYETRYEQIFQNRSSAFAEQLNHLLPRAHKDLSDCALNIAAARNWMLRVSQNRSPQSDGTDLLRAYELFAARRRMFISAVKEYNLGIVRYTEIATPGTLDTERLVAMLIRTGGSEGTTYDSSVRRAGAEEGADTNDSSSTQRVDPGVSDWTPVRGDSSERSILVPRRSASPLHRTVNREEIRQSAIRAPAKRDTMPGSGTATLT